MLRTTATPMTAGLLARSFATSSRTQLQVTSLRSAAQAERKPRSASGRNATGDKARKAREKLARPRKEGLAPRGDDGSPLYPLRPNELARRIKQICDEGKFEEAVSVLKAAPTGAQNTPVWNTAIWECLKCGKYKLAFKLFTDMKRRGFQPSIRTYSSMLSGYARIPGPKWSTLAVQLDNVQTIYGQFITLIDELKRTGKIDATLYEHISTARAGYITVLGENGLHQRMFDAYNSMETSGPLAPDGVVFTAMFKALMARKVLGSAVRPEEHDYESGMLLSPGSARPQNAADARLLWRQMLKIFEVNTEAKLGERYSIDTFLLREVIGVLTLGRPSDQAFALDLIREHLHLSAPSEAVGSDGAIKPLTSKPPLLTEHTFDATLELANEMKRYRLAIQLFQQVVDLEDTLIRAAGRKRGADVHAEPSILDRGHADRILLAYSCLPGEADQALELVRWMVRRVALGEHRMRPEASSFEHVLIAAWRSGNWDVATSTWELMTGYRLKSFVDGRPSGAPEQERISRGKLALEPGPQHASAFARSALVKRNPGNSRACLRMLEAVNVKEMIPSTSFGNGDTDGNSSKSVRRHIFFGHKLAEAIVPLVNDAVGDVPPAERTDEQRRWLSLLHQAKKARNGSSPGISGTGDDAPSTGARRGVQKSQRSSKPRGPADAES